MCDRIESRTKTSTFFVCSFILSKSNTLFHVHQQVTLYDNFSSELEQQLLLKVIYVKIVQTMGGLDAYMTNFTYPKLLRHPTTLSGQPPPPMYKVLPLLTRKIFNCFFRPYCRMLSLIRTTEKSSV